MTADLVKRLRLCADDPMWAHHAEVPKALLTEAADALSTNDDVVKALEEVVGGLKQLGHWREESHDWDADMGHDLRTFDVEDWDLIEAKARRLESIARTALSRARGETRP